MRTQTPSTTDFKERATVSTPAAVRVQSFGTTVFAEYSALSLEYDAINLGQGFPDFPAPNFVIEAARTALSSGYNQYARSAGHPRLVNALAAVYSPVFDRELDPLTQIVVTTGATEGIFATMQGLVDPGDEVILIEPFYDSYPAAVIMAGGTPVYIPAAPRAGRDQRGGLADRYRRVAGRDQPEDQTAHHQYAPQPGRQDVQPRGVGHAGADRAGA